MEKVCFVPSCQCSSKFGPKIVFFNVPRDMELRKAWFVAVGKENIPRGHAYYCCEDHFNLSEDTSNWMRNKFEKGITLKLIPNTVPHRNLRLEENEQTPKCLQEVSLNVPSPNKKPRIATEIIVVASTSTSQSFQSESSFASKSSSFTSTQSATSTSSDPEIMEVKQQDLMALRENSTIQLVENQPRFYLGLPKNTYYLLKIITKYEKITYRNVLITLKKIRLDDVYVRLANDFGCSTSTIQRVFVDSLPKIANIMQHFVFFPTQAQIKKLLPIPFRFRYSSVQYIIDCFEIEIQKPSNPVNQSHTWSEYKKCNTIKYLVSATPNGFINFISGGFGGRITDNNIVIASNYLENISDCGIMADRGFKHVAALVAERNCILIRPPSVSDSTPLNKDQAKEAKRIAALRIHIERIIRRIREFKMLDIHSRINTNLIYLLDCIVIIVCGLCNLQGPLLK